MDDIIMSKKERTRLEIFSRVKEGIFTQTKAASLLGISYRQTRRMYKRYKEEGDKGILHKSRGKTSNRRIALSTKELVIGLYEEKYKGFGPTLASEHLLSDDGYNINHETLRQWLIKAGVWQRKRKRKKHRTWRERKEYVGEMVQMDGSHHDWFEGRGEKATLMVMVDDASSRTFAQFYNSETTRACMEIFWKYVDVYKLPRALYVDRHSIYRCEREATVEEQLKQVGPLTQFGRAMNTLDVRIIPAYSAQAKGRVERVNRTMQDRLVKKMRLKGISTLEDANSFLIDEFLPEYNDKYNVVPRNKKDIHKKLPKGLLLEEVLCIEDYRQVQNDWTTQRKNRLFQLTKRSEAMGLVKQRIVVREKLDGEIQLIHKGSSLKFKEIKARPEKIEITVEHTKKSKEPYKPSGNHPWRKYKTRSYAASGKNSSTKMTQNVLNEK